jgi:O-antigen ligase
MIVATFRSLSRSGLIGLALALLALWGGQAVNCERVGRRARAPVHDSLPDTTAARRHRWPLLLVVLAAGIGIVLYIDPQTLAARFGGAAPAAVDRLTIWRETLPVIRDSWLTGTGLGTYLTAMLVYQQTQAGVIFNQAHNHFLQIATEGGLLAAIPAALAAASLVRAGARALRNDTSGIYWIRAGAAAGLGGVAAQSVWETGLTIPANGALAAVLLAILLHTPAAAGRGGAWR